MQSKIINKMNWWFTIIVLVTANLLPISAEPIPFPEELPHNENGEPQSRVRVRRQYYVCPPEFELISNNCYYFSKQMATWQDAHHDCRDRHSELAMLQTPAEDKKLRGQLNKLTNPMEWWIGGIYDWEQMKWKWGTSGKKLDYHGFSRMGPDNKEKLKWHCIILDPHMKYKWSSRSCVHGKHYICQKKVMRVNERGLKKLRKQYNSALNEIRAPILHNKLRKNRKHENFANGQGGVPSGFKHHRPNGINVQNTNYKQFNNAFGHRRNTTELRKGRKGKGRKGLGRKKNRQNKNKELDMHLRNGTLIDHGGYPPEYRRNNQKRNRRNKSKESQENNSLENSTFSQDEINKRKRKKWNKENSNSMDDMTQKTSYMANTISPLHPRVIVEVHDFLDLNHH